MALRRTPLRRRTPLKPSRGTQWPTDEAQAIKVRDGHYCVCRRANLPTEGCPGTPVDLHHVRAGGMGVKSRSTRDNGVCLSRSCHRWATEHTADARPRLLEYLARFGYATTD